MDKKTGGAAKNTFWAIEEIETGFFVYFKGINNIPNKKYAGFSHKYKAEVYRKTFKYADEFRSVKVRIEKVEDGKEHKEMPR